jgi:hypothetical protein
MINFNNIFVIIVFTILILGLIYSSSFFIYFMYFSIIIYFIWGIVNLLRQKIRVKNFTLNSFNKPASNGASSFMWLLLSIIGFIVFYNNYGFPFF